MITDTHYKNYFKALITRITVILSEGSTCIGQRNALV